MKQTEFGQLLGISKQMVFKYAERGLLVRDDNGEIDARASLDLLRGHLAEEKHKRALEALSAQPQLALMSADARGARIKGLLSGRARRDEIEAELKALDLGLRKRELVLAADVAERAREAVAMFRRIRANARREEAAKLCAQFGIPPDRVSAVARFLAAEDEVALGRFAKACAALAGGDVETTAGYAETIQ